ncbi:4-hydroxythreonine-4-phosphate dehydrogenase PdxA [Virgibacillus oceani]
MRPIIGITMGDVAGIGPEIIIKALSNEKVYSLCHPIVIGDVSILEKHEKIINSGLGFHSIENVEEAKFIYGTIDCLDLNLFTDDIEFGKISPRAGNAAYQYIYKAVDLTKKGEIQAICTAPLNKAALAKGGHSYPGHTEILADLTETSEYSMMLSSPNLKVIHLTTHVGIKEAIDLITPKRTETIIHLADRVLKSAGNKKPKIAVCGINPHAGENGLFGESEEEEKLIPAIERAQAEGIDVSGPHAADTLFFRAFRGEFDIVIACYHDQGHIPIKLLGLEEGVNITVGLNHGVIRTSVDHGTAFDIAGKNIADSRSMIAAIEAAVELVPK